MTAVLFFAAPALILVLAALNMLQNRRETARQLAAAQQELREQWKFDNWHFRTFGWVPR